APPSRLPHPSRAVPRGAPRARDRGGGGGGLGGRGPARPRHALPHAGRAARAGAGGSDAAPLGRRRSPAQALPDHERGTGPAGGRGRATRAAARHRPDARGRGDRMRLARLLLALYPPGLRREHGEEMEALLAARLRAARGPGAVTGLVAHTIADAGRTWWGGGPARHGNGRSGMGGWMQDAGYALRRLRATPLFTLGAAAIIAVAIGANTAMFALVRAALWERPPYADVDRLVHVYQDSDEGEPSSNSFPAYEDMRAVDEVFASVGATSPDRATLALGSE